MQSVQTSIQTLGEVMDYMATFAGGSVPSENTTEWQNWRRWIQNKQEEYAKRGFWRRLLTREEVTLDGDTTLLPDRFYKPNGLYMCIVDGVDWMDYWNTDEQNIFVEMVTDPDSDDYAKWQMRFDDEVDNETAILWYFANPPKPTDSSDKLLLPGDMIAYAALTEYFRSANQEGSMDKAEEDAENRFEQYMNFEVIPSKNELLTHTEQKPARTMERKRDLYATRSRRHYQG